MLETKKILTHGSLFSGIGGFDLAAEWIGWKNLMQCEINKFCQRILKYYWPKAVLYNDIKTTDFRFWESKIDVLTGGFPCQPYSIAGKRLGKDDNRHLWPEMLRAIREIQPGYIVGENVYGLINWNGGLVFNQVQTDLENEGYQVCPVILPACSKDAPHKRERIWFIAYSLRNGFGGTEEFEERFETYKKWLSRNELKPFFRLGASANAKSLRFQRGKQANNEKGSKPNDKQFDGCNRKWDSSWSEWPTQSPFVAEMMGYPPDWTELPFLSGGKNQSRDMEMR